MTELLLPQEGEVVTLLQPEHITYLEKPMNTAASDVDWLRLRQSQTDRSLPKPVSFSFSPAVDGELLLHHPNGSVSRHTAQKGQAQVWNLQIGVTYHWQVIVDGKASEKRTFHTHPQPPRLLYVEGISNVRDFGGYTTKSGQRIRQGLLYRTSELDTHVTITENGKRTWESLGIRTDLDIRGIQDEPRCPNLDTHRTQWINIPLAAYDRIFTPEQIAAYGKSFALLTVAERYPMIVHCWGGIDRTGCWLFLLGGMLGIPSEQLFLDYEFSSFSRWGRRSRYSDQFCTFLQKLMTYGDTLEDACRHFMRAAGLTDAQLAQIKDILLEN